jgi:mannan endo-1,4-beta-mannosidase
MMRVIVCLTLLFIPSAGAAARAQTSEFENFVTRRGDQLLDGDRPLRFVSFNIPNLLVIEDAFEFLGDSPWRWPDAFEIGDALESVRQMRGRVARSYVISVRREGSDMGACVHVLGPGEFNEEAFAALDLVLKTAHEKGVRVIIPLVDNWKWMGGAGQYAAFRGKTEQQFWTDRQLIDDFKQTIRYVVNRRNTLTGELYRDDRAILGWETGNELDAPQAWTAEIAAYLKELDPNHLVIDGRSLHGLSEDSLADPNVDVVTTHHYPAAGVDVVERVETAARQAQGRKPYFVGEVGFISVAETRRVFEAVAASQAAGVLHWSLRFHRREGGFYWHSEPSGANLFKAYHWPGFATGDDYEERELLQIVAEFAERVDRSPREPLPIARPRLLPIEHPGRISWQGSSGAVAYDVERAATAAGPWTVVGEGIDDTLTQYRPLFCDPGASSGESYFYRVTARGAAGATAMSNVVGPVAVAHRLLVDELADDALLDRTEGVVERRTGDPRRVQEDAHRWELAPGGAVVYEVPADATSVTAWVFASTAGPDCQISVSGDGQTFAPVASQASTTNRDQGDYGYLRPTLLRAAIDQPAVRFIRIANGAASDDPEESPYESTADGRSLGVQTFELSRIEITYDQR